MNPVRNTLLVFILILSSCSNKRYDNWFNTDLELIEITCSQPNKDGVITVDIKNLSMKSIAYVSLWGFHDSPEFLLTRMENGKETTYSSIAGMINVFEIEYLEILHFKFSKTNNLVKVGFPIYNSELEQKVIWFYHTNNENLK